MQTKTCLCSKVIYTNLKKSINWNVPKTRTSATKSKLCFPLSNYHSLVASSSLQSPFSPDIFDISALIPHTASLLTSPIDNQVPNTHHLILHNFFSVFFLILFLFYVLHICTHNFQFLFTMTCTLFYALDNL